MKAPDSNIAPSWWKSAKSIDPAGNRAVFAMDWIDMLAIGIEIEKATLRSLFPDRGKTPRGRRPLHDWEGAWRHVEAYVAEHGPLSEKARVVELVEEYFGSLGEKPPERESIYRKLQASPREWTL